MESTCVIEIVSGVASIISAIVMVVITLYCNSARLDCMFSWDANVDYSLTIRLYNPSSRMITIKMISILYDNKSCVELNSCDDIELKECSFLLPGHCAEIKIDPEKMKFPAWIDGQLEDNHVLKVTIKWNNHNKTVNTTISRGEVLEKHLFWKYNRS